MKWWIILLGILVVVVLFRPVSGRDVLRTTVTGPLRSPQTAGQIQLARQIAKDYWGNDGRCLHISYLYRPLSAGTIAQATWWSTGAAPNVYLHCSVTFDSNRIRVSFALYCGAVVHEWGHLSGREHVQNPRNVMFRVLSEQNIPRVCREGAS